MDDDNRFEHSRQLLLAVCDGNKTAMRDLLSTNPDINFFSVNAFTVDGDTAFIYSLHHYLNGNSAITKLLLPYSNCLPLPHTPATLDKNITNLQFIDFIKLLISHQADFLADTEKNKLQLVKLLLVNEKLQLLWDLIEAGLYLQVITDYGENIYHLIAKYCSDVEKVDCCHLIFHNINLHLKNKDQNTPLMIASFLHNRAFMECCIGESGRGHNLSLQNGNGHTALHLCIIGFAAIVKTLEERTSHSKQLCDFNYYPDFHYCIDMLLKADIDVNIKDNSGKTALMKAVMANDKILVKKLLVRADPWVVDDEGYSAIQYFNFAENTEDLACFNLLYAQTGREGNRVLNLPQINGQTIIQNMLTFSQLWKLDQSVLFIKFLIGCNISLKRLISTECESCSFITLEQLSSEERMKLREMFYLSGAPSEEIIEALNFDAEERAMQSPDHRGPRRAFFRRDILQSCGSSSEITPSLEFDAEERAMQSSGHGGPKQASSMCCNNLCLDKICRRDIGQSCGSSSEIHSALKFKTDEPALQSSKAFNFDAEEGAIQSSDHGGPRKASAMCCNAIDKICRRDIGQSCGSSSEITPALKLKTDESALQSPNHDGPRNAFAMFCNNLCLEKRCRRVIRQSYGSRIQDVAASLSVPHLSDFLLLNDCPEYGIPQSLDDDRFIHNQVHNDDNVNYNLYDFETQTDGDRIPYDHILYLNEKSFYNFS